MTATPKVTLQAPAHIDPGPHIAAAPPTSFPIPLPLVIDEGASASRWLFRAADEALLAFVQQARPRIRGLSDFAAQMLTQLSLQQLDWVRTNLAREIYLLDEWNAIQPSCLLAFERALTEIDTQNKLDAQTEIAEPTELESTRTMTALAQPVAQTAETTAIEPAIPEIKTEAVTTAPVEMSPLPSADQTSGNDAHRECDARQIWQRVLAGCNLPTPTVDVEETAAAGSDFVMAQPPANTSEVQDTPDATRSLLDDAAIALLEQCRTTKSREQRRRHMVACLNSPALQNLLTCLANTEARALERRLNTLIRDGVCAQACGVLLGLLQRIHSPAKTDAAAQTANNRQTPANESQEDATVTDLPPQPLPESSELQEAELIVSHFLARLPEGGNEQHRKRTVQKVLLQTNTTELGILISRANLHQRNFNSIQVAQSRKRSLLMVPEVFERMTDPLGDPAKLVASELLKATDVKTANSEDPRGSHFRLTLLCGLYGRLHRLHLHRRANNLKSNWNQLGQGLLHFNFLHTITGLDAVPQLAGLLQTAFCESLLSAGRMIPETATLQEVWDCTEEMRQRTQLRARMLVRNPMFLGTALQSHERFSALISSLTVCMMHSRLIVADPLRRQLAASLLRIFAETLLAEMAPFNTFKNDGAAT